MVEKFRRFRLRNGRWLAYSQYGASRGKPILYFHGWPGSRLEARVADQTAKEFNATLIAIDRPGLGMSDFQPGRAILDWPADVSEIADALRLERFAIAGISGGGPYALACALRIPERLTSVAIICGVGPTEVSGAMEGMSPFPRRVFYLCRKAPWLLRAIFAQTAWRLARNPEWYLSRILRLLPEPDREALTRSELRQTIVDSTLEAVRSGTRGTVWEGRLYTSAWTFRLQDIRTEIHLWHGERDVSVPPAMGYFQARSLPNCRARFYPEEGHFSLVTNHMAEFFEVLTSR